MRATGLLDRTIVIISADHGEELFDHGWLGHASTGYDAKLYDELIRIPLIIRVPETSLRGRFDALVQGVDFMPTIFDLLGIDTTEIVPHMQGHSLLPLIEGRQAKIRDYVFSQTSLKGWTTPRSEMKARIVSVRSKDGKLIRIPGDDGVRTEAYDLRRDPGELDNIYVPGSDRFRALESALNSWVDDNRRVAARLVIDGANARIDRIAERLLREANLKSAVSAWTAIQTMEETWGLEPDPFYDTEPFASQWKKVQQTAARMVGLAMTCQSRGGVLRTARPDGPLLVDDWICD
jgi:hypothetical protein